MMSNLRSFPVCSFLLLLLLLGGTRRPGVLCAAKLQAALILPHGDAAWDPFTIPSTDKEARAAALEIAQAARTGAAWFAIAAAQQQQTVLDVIVLISPHGVALSNDFGVYWNAAAGGRAEIGSDNQNHDNTNYSTTYTVTLPFVPLAPALSRQLVEALQHQNNVTGIQFPETNIPGTVPMVLSWAEVIPLLLLDTAKSENSNQQQQQQHLIWTQPLRRFDHPARRVISELLQLGQRLGDWMDGDDQQGTNFGVLVSGDLSHTHRADGPYGYSAAAAALDRALGAWASGDPCCSTNANALLVTAAALQDEALSCGFTGFVLLHGMLCRNNRNDQQQWKSDVLVNRNATYFGMMVANLSRTTTTTSSFDDDDGTNAS